jgi:hypothetical protein
VRVFKCGPDFIDPMLLERASGAPVESLDLWMVGANSCRASWRKAARRRRFLIEGVMGLYDGTPSSADLAREFGVPVLAVIDAGAMAQTAGALVHGLRDYGPGRDGGRDRQPRRQQRPCGDGAHLAARHSPVRHAAEARVVRCPNGIWAWCCRPKWKVSTPCSTNWRRSWTSTRRHGRRCALPSSPAPAQGLAPAAGRPHDRHRARRRVRLCLPGQPGPAAHTGRQGGILSRRWPTSRCRPTPMPSICPAAIRNCTRQRLSAATRWRAIDPRPHADGMPIVAECGGMMALADALADGARHVADGGHPARHASRCRSALPAWDRRRWHTAGRCAATLSIIRASTPLKPSRTHRQASVRRAGRGRLPRRLADRIVLPRLLPVLPGGGGGAVYAGDAMTRTLVLGGARSGKSAHAEGSLRITAGSGLHRHRPRAATAKWRSALLTTAPPAGALDDRRGTARAGR